MTEQTAIDAEGDAPGAARSGVGWRAVLLVAGIGLVATLVGTAVSHATSAQAEAARRAEISFAARSALQADLVRLTSQVGAFVAWIEQTGLDDPVALESFYRRATALAESVPWRAVAVAEVLPRSDLPARVARVEANRRLYDAARYPELRVFPPSSADPAIPVLMVEPRESRARVFGFDMASDPARREAVLAALELDRATSTAPLTLSQDAYGDDVREALSLLMVAPVERPRGEDRRAVLAFSITPDELVARAMARASEASLSYRMSMDGVSVAAALEHAREHAIDVEQVVLVEQVTPQLLRAHFLGQHWNIELDFAARSAGVEDAVTLIVFLLGLAATGLAVALTRRVYLERTRLEQKLADRTRELDQTRDAIADAYRIDALGRLTGGVAHDFNNLLGVISGNLDLLRDTLPESTDAIAQEFIDDAATATDRGARLTQKLLTLSRQASLRPEPLDLDDIAQDMAGVLRRTLPATIEIQTRLAEHLPRVLADRVQLESALLNLAINARDAMPDGGRLTLATALIDGPGDHEGEAGPHWIEISVTDTGTGMPPEIARRALDPFFTTKEVGRGTGLGLSIVAGFVSQSGGDIQVDSVPDRGTSIRLRFPPASGAVTALREDAQEWVPVARDEEVILVIEDNAELRLILDRQLRALGYEVLTAEEGRAGLLAVQRANRIDLVLSDCVLPGELDGYGIARALRASHPGLPVLLMSGYADPPSPETDDPALLPIRLTKPLKRAELAQTIRQTIDDRDPH